MEALGQLCSEREEHEHAVQWWTKGAEAGLPDSMFNLGCSLDKGAGVAAPDYVAAADWYRRAADAGRGDAANNLSALYQVGRGVTRSKRRTLQWMRTAADNGHTKACLQLANRMYMDIPHAREAGHVGDAAGAATSAGAMEGHEVPPDVFTGVVHWLWKGGYNPIDELAKFRREALVGATYCYNNGCETVGQVKDFKRCSQCKIARYCGDACQKQDWTTGGHKERCGTYGASTRRSTLQ
jgi:hypothetical protein